jgi:glycosyltransferase involved in cell wall biosynthesis
MRALMLSTHDEPCGIADFNSSLAAALTSRGVTADTVRLPRFDPSGLATACHIFQQKLSQFEIGIIQHEWGFFGSDFRRSAHYFAKFLNSLDHKTRVVIFMHTAFPPLPSSRMFSFFSRNAKMRAAKRAFIAALNRRTRVFIHGDDGRDKIVGLGIETGRATSIMLPCHTPQNITRPRPLNDGDEVILTIFGFISEYKGYETVLNAMRLLPDRVKLVIAGGKHPRHAADKTLDSIYGFLHTGTWPRSTMEGIPNRFTKSERERLRGRVQVTGFVPRDAIADIINNTDIALAVYADGPLGSAALCEVLSFGRPIIASCLSSFEQIDKRGDCIRFVPVGCPFELAESILALIQDHRERLRLHQNALAFARKHTFSELAELVIEAIK